MGEDRIVLRPDNRSELVVTKSILGEINKATITARAYILDPSEAKSWAIDTSFLTMKKELGEENFKLFLGWTWKNIRRWFGRWWVDKWLKELEVRKGKNKIKVKLKTPDGCATEIDYEPSKLPDITVKEPDAPKDGAAPTPEAKNDGAPKPEAKNDATTERKN